MLPRYCEAGTTVPYDIVEMHEKSMRYLIIGMWLHTEAKYYTVATWTSCPFRCGSSQNVYSCVAAFQTS